MIVQKTSLNVIQIRFLRTFSMSYIVLKNSLSKESNVQLQNNSLVVAIIINVPVTPIHSEITLG